MNEDCLIIPVFNGCPALRVCLASLAWTDEIGVMVLVVDAGSMDGSVECVSETLPSARLLHADPTMWWTASVDFGCRHARTVFGASRLYLLNHDCTWTRRDFETLRSALAEHPSDITCSRVVSAADGSLVFGGGVVTHWGMATTHDPKRPAEDEASGRVIDWCGGMGVGFAADTFMAIGGFDATAFPHYYGDVDFCLRAARRGVRVWYCPASTVVNDTSSSGLELPRDGLTLRVVTRSLVSRHSVWNIRDTTRFYLRHAGRRAPLALLQWYGLWAAVSGRRLLRSVGL